MGGPTDTRAAGCFDCGAVVDPFTSPQRVLGGRVVPLCGGCAGGGRNAPSVSPPSVPSPPAPDGLYVAEARATAPGERDGRGGRRLAGRPLLLGAGLFGGAALFAIALFAFSDGPAEATSHERGTPLFETLAETAKAGAAEVSSSPTLLSLYRGEFEWVEPAEQSPSRAAPASKVPGAESWIHPLAETDEPIPVKVTRQFGATRGGNRPSECGRGHCGVDLAAPRGTPVVAVQKGTVHRVVRDPNRSSGKYVHLVHPGGAETLYMHLDDILPGLDRGASVRAGEMLGSLGKTGIANSEPHLHFGVTVPRRRGGLPRYVDPEPALKGARVIRLLDLRVSVDPPEPKSARAD